MVVGTGEEMDEMIETGRFPVSIVGRRVLSAGDDRGSSNVLAFSFTMGGLLDGPKLNIIDNRRTDLEVAIVGVSRTLVGGAGAARGRRRSTDNRRERGGRDVDGRGSDREDAEKVDDCDGDGEGGGFEADLAEAEDWADADEDRRRNESSTMLDGRTVVVVVVVVVVVGYLARAGRGVAKYSGEGSGERVGNACGDGWGELEAFVEVVLDLEMSGREDGV